MHVLFDQARVIGNNKMRSLVCETAAAATTANKLGAATLVIRSMCAFKKPHMKHQQDAFSVPVHSPRAHTLAVGLAPVGLVGVSGHAGCQVPVHETRRFSPHK